MIFAKDIIASKNMWIIKVKFVLSKPKTKTKKYLLLDL
jgi:hypothetical protein